jgi:hypothetical protein
MKLQILILTQPSRKEFLAQLHAILAPQIVAQGLRDSDPVGLLVHTQEEGDLRPVGEKREELRQQATAEYISFVDDDDFVSPNYVAKILPLLDGVDQVCFQVKMWDNGHALPLSYNSIRYGKWWNDSNGFYRDISHAMPMRRELALQVAMSGGFGEDFRWAAGMRNKGIIKSEHVINEPLYYYLIREPKRDATDAREPWRLKILADLKAQTDQSL